MLMATYTFYDITSYLSPVINLLATEDAVNLIDMYLYVLKIPNSDECHMSIIQYANICSAQLHSYVCRITMLHINTITINSVD